METEITLYWLGGGIFVALLASLGDRARRSQPFAWHAHLPWRATLFVAVGVALFAAAHLLTLVKQGAV